MSRADGQTAARRVDVLRLPHGAGLALPAYQSEGAAGLDLLAARDDAAPLTLAPGARALVPTGLILELPQAIEAQVRPRSGLALQATASPCSTAPAPSTATIAARCA